jgi:hypothetical protein
MRSPAFQCPHQATERLTANANASGQDESQLSCVLVVAIWSEKRGSGSEGRTCTVHTFDASQATS